ncbi:MAG TPA: glycosyltransferase [Solirubrobacteraceae bacterium]|nr:glycosyltransferase [Solirubrobacteraceae bacterium]
MLMRARADVSVVLCAYTEQRAGQLREAIESVHLQTVGVREVIVVIDNNPVLARHAREHLRGVTTIENHGPRGAGQSRNRGVQEASGEIVAFLDDDAIAAPDWVEKALRAFEDPCVLGVGGTIEPAWEGRPPAWMAPEFYWTVGCTYAGLPTSPAPVRNLIATNMFVRREQFLALGGFRAGFGKTGARSGTEETELCIRGGQRWPERRWLHDPSVAVMHRVPRARARLRYFLSRCYDEGVAKASIVAFVGARDGLAAEREYARRTLPNGFVTGFRLRGRASGAGVARSASILLGLMATASGYALGRLAVGGSQSEQSEQSEADGERGGGIVVVGSGTRFISGVSHYTRYVACALEERERVAVILMRRLIPRAFYPGRARVGDDTLTDERYPASMPVFDGVDWYWLPSIVTALRFLRRERPRAVLFQWWTGSVLHTYLALALLARMLGATVLVEIHELQDTGEAGMAPARGYVRRFGGRLMALADGFVVHSEFDREALAGSYPLGRREVRVVRHGPYSHYAVAEAAPRREAPTNAKNILFFGTIRPYKGLEDLVRAFELLAAEDDEVWLTVVGETWEDWNEPSRLIAASRFKDRITLVNRYVSDTEASEWFAGADVVALPYRRSSASGPLHLSMDAGLPVVLGDVGGLREAAEGYTGAVLVAPADPPALCTGLREAIALMGTSHPDPTSWRENARAVLELLGDPAIEDGASQPVLLGV